MDQDVARNSNLDRISFKHLGPLKNANVDLNRLTIIIGDNNVGKTYLSYGAYFLYNNLPKIQNSFVFLAELNKSKKIKKITTKLEETYKYELSKDEANEIYELIKTVLLRRFKELLSDLFKVDEDYFKKVEVDFEFSDKLEDRKKESPFTSGSISLTMTGANYVINTTNNYVKENDITKKLAELFSPQFHKSFAISAERLGIVLFRKELDARRSNIVNQLQQLSNNNNKLQEKLLLSIINDYTSRYSSAIHDNIDYVRDMFIKRKKLGQFETGNKSSNRLIKIMGGSLKSNSEVDELRFYSNRKKVKFDIPLHFASTSVRSLTMLYHYLKYDAEVGDLLFIDEPESHLSIGNQIELIRLLVLCVNKGIRIFLTTHSEMMLKELNNMIKYFNVTDEDQARYDITLPYKDRDYSINHEFVSVYEITKGETKKAVVSKDGVSSDLFDNTIDSLNQVSDNLDFLSSLGE